MQELVSGNTRSLDCSVG